MSDYILIDGKIKFWPMCPIKGCTNRICLSLHSDKCWPHTKSDKSFSDIMKDCSEDFVGEQV